MFGGWATLEKTPHFIKMKEIFKYGNIKCQEELSIEDKLQVYLHIIRLHLILAEYRQQWNTVGSDWKISKISRIYSQVSYIKKGSWKGNLSQISGNSFKESQQREVTWTVSVSQSAETAPQRHIYLPLIQTITIIHSMQNAICHMILFITGRRKTQSSSVWSSVL